MGIKDRYETFHHVEYTPEAIEAAVYQSSRYITDRFLPDKAIDLIDEAGARAKLREAELQRRVRRDQQEHPRRRRADGRGGVGEGRRDGPALPRAGADGPREPAASSASGST